MGMITKIYVLAQLGSTFRTTPTTENFGRIRSPQLEVADIDGDGNPEVIFEDHSYGTGGGSSSLYVYFPLR